MVSPRVIPLVLSLGALVLPAIAGAAEPLAPIAPAAPPASASAFVPGKVIVVWAAGAERADKVEAREEAEVTYEANLGDPSFQLVGVEAGQSVDAAIEELETDPAVSVAERDGYAVPTSVPNDPLFGEQWALQNLGTGIDGFSGAIAGDDIDATDAWDRTVGIGAKVVVADIDTGYRFDSPDLGPVAWTNYPELNGTSGTDDDGNGYVDDVHGYDFVGDNSEAPSEDADPTDDDLLTGGHGVHTAGIIGAQGDNGVGITGVAQNIRIMPLRVCSNAPSFNQSLCPISSTIAAINYAGHNEAQVANLSLSGTSSSEAELDAFAENPGTVFVIAAGNDAQDDDLSPHYPCVYEPGATAIAGATENIICVAATDQADKLASFSDYGANSVDLGAPGTQILSTYPATEAVIEDDFETDNFATRWKTTGANGGFERTDESPLTSFGITDSAGAAAVAESGRSSTLAAPVAVPAGDGSCSFSGLDSVSLGGGTVSLIIFRNGTADHTFSLPETSAAAMRNFSTVPMVDLAGSSVGVRVRYIAGPSPSANSGVWLDDLTLRCNAPLTTPPTYAFLQGTSMAAPMVTGAVVLLDSEEYFPSAEEITYALLEGVDPDPSLAGKTVSGGRLDVARALDWLAPPAPTLSTDPGSPADNAEPRIVGSVAAGTRVKLFAGATCEGSPVAIGTPAELASPGFPVEVQNGATEEFSAIVETKFNGSGCSTPIAYNNSSAPDAPRLSTSPVSPAANSQPHIVGQAEPGSIVDLYVGANCGSPSPLEISTAEKLASPGIEVQVDEETTAEFSATATDEEGKTSPCSDPISFTNTTPFLTFSVPLFDKSPAESPSASPPAAATPSCTVPKLAGKTLAKAKSALKGADCELGKIAKPTGKAKRKAGALVVAGSSPAAGAKTSGAVALRLAPKRAKRHH